MPSLSPFIILVIVVVLLCTGTYVQYAITPLKPTEKSSFRFEPVISLKPQSNSPSYLPPTPKNSIPEACKEVDFHWLASDRTFWDGWSSKAMFMKKNGKFTRKNIHIGEGESICIAVLLGPIPAFASIKAMDHYAPSDSIVMTAKSKTTSTRIPITLRQHDKQTNAYYAAVQFNQHDTYILDTSVEYRSYFWESPNFHKYLPNKFTSRNRLTVFKRDTKKENDSENQCNYPFDLKSSVWMEKQHYQQIDPVGFYNSPFNMPGSDLIYVPNCALKPISAGFNKEIKNTIHVWGDRYLKRNIQFLKGDILSTDLCNDIQHNDFEHFDTPIEVDGADIYFSEVSNGIGFDYRNEWKSKIQDHAHKLPSANVVLIGIGNYDLPSVRQSPNEFAMAFTSLLHHLIHNVYTNDEIIIVKTTQYYGSYYPSGGWNQGRSEAYANIIRSTVSSLNKKRVLLWDTHQLGLSDNQACNDKSNSNSNVIQVENTLLSNLIYAAAA